MFDISISQNGEVLLSGRFDASQVEKAEEVFNSVAQTSTVNFKDLDYISSAGIAILLSTHKRLSNTGNRLILINMNKHISDVFRLAGLDRIFEIEQ